ncbi:MAG: hypothetical protein GXZ05_09765 [Gammaproteobacteria bacterium]|nr:hypothetical protein [Gammaproteobacteria bacterium]
MAKKHKDTELLLGIAALITLPFIALLRLIFRASTDLPSKPLAANLAEHVAPPSSAHPRDKALDSFVCAVAGTSFDTGGKSRSSFIHARVRPGDTVDFVREPDNPYDRNAIAVYVHGFQIGYLRRSVAERHSELADDPAFYVLGNVREVVYSNPPGVYLNFASYVDHKATDAGLVQLLPSGRYGRVLLTAKHDGKTTKEWLESHPQDFRAMLACCKAELDLYKTNSLNDISPPSPAPFLRACIIARKDKNYKHEIRVAQTWLALARKHDADPLVASGARKPLTGTSADKNIRNRLPRAMELLAASEQ